MNTSEKKGSASFCIPRAAIAGLLAAKATADEIVAYLILARFTEESGVFSSAGHSALNRYTGGNKRRGGKLDRALQRLTEIPGVDPDTGELLEPIVYYRNRWRSTYGAEPPDGPTERGQILHVLPDFDEPISERAWIGAHLVDGIGTFQRPLRTLRQGGDVAARLLLKLFELNDLHTWLGIDPTLGVRMQYEHALGGVRLPGSSELHIFKRDTQVASLIEAFFEAHDAQFFEALEFLESAGFIYECVTVLDRRGIPQGDGTDEIPDDSEPLYELDVRSARGLPPEGAKRLSGLTARIAASEGYAVFDREGRYDGSYAAIVPQGQAANVIGIYRLRFRVANARNGWVSGAWAGHFQRQDDARANLEHIASRCGITLSA